MSKRLIARINGNKITVYLVSDEYVRDCILLPAVEGNDKIVKYLKSSFYIAILLDSTKSLFEDRQITSFETYLTDGNWIWSGDLEHYTEKYKFKWPAAFVESIRFMTPVNINTPVEEITKLELIFHAIRKNIFQEEWNGPGADLEIPVYEFEIIDMKHRE